jgi:hypothetical protein
MKLYESSESIGEGRRIQENDLLQRFSEELNYKGTRKKTTQNSQLKATCRPARFSANLQDQ